jgi:hypothetical protein
MNDPALLASTLRYLDGQLPPAETRALARRLVLPGQDRYAVARLLLQLAHIEELGHDQTPVRPQLVVAPALPPPTARRRWIGAGTATAALALAAAVFLLWPRPPPSDAPVARSTPARPLSAPARSAGSERRLWPDPPAPSRPARPVGTLAASSGMVRLIADRPIALRPGAALLDGQEVETVGAGARAVLAVAGGARLELEGSGLLAIAGDDTNAGAQLPDRVLLERGSLQVDLGAVAGDFSIVSPVVEVRGRRSRFKLAASAGELRVWVDSGQVTLTRLPDHRSLIVEAGAGALMTETQAAAIPPPSRPVALLVVGSWPVPRALETDNTLAGRLERLGYTVARMPDTRLERGALADKALVVVSPSTSAAVVRERLPSSGLREAPLPIVNCETEAMPALGMAIARGNIPGRSRLNLLGGQHPLAGGLAGNVRVTEAPAPLMWARPTADATVIATLDVDARPSVFGYETGARMNGLTAPARRVSCFLSELATLQASEAGWQLFDAAVRWAGPVKR